MHEIENKTKNMQIYKHRKEIQLTNLAVYDKLYKLLLTDPMNSINHGQARKNPPRVADLR